MPCGRSLYDRLAGVVVICRESLGCWCCGVRSRSSSSPPPFPLCCATISWTLFVLLLLCSEHQAQLLHSTPSIPLSTTIPSSHSCCLHRCQRVGITLCHGAGECRVQTVGLAWKSIMRDRAENSHYSTVRMLLVRCAPCAACTTTTHHWPPQGGFTFCHSSWRTVVAWCASFSVPPDGRRSSLNKTQAHQSRHSPFSRPAVFVTYG